MKILYRLFLLILIIWWVAHGLYWMFHYSLFANLPDIILFHKIKLIDFVRILIWISAIIVLLSNFSISFQMKPKDED